MVAALIDDYCEDGDVDDDGDDGDDGNEDAGQPENPYYFDEQ